MPELSRTSEQAKRSGKSGSRARSLWPTAALIGVWLVFTTACGLVVWFGRSPAEVFQSTYDWLSDLKSTLDHYGRGFCLVHRGDIDVSAFSAAASERNIPFSNLQLAGKDQEVLYEKALVLVRPDGQVAWRSDELPSDPGAILDLARGSARSARDVVDRRSSEPGKNVV